MTFHRPRRLDKKPSEKRESSLYRSICISILSTLLSMVMLVGTTFAWFTSSVTSNVFTIQSGNFNTLTQYSVNLPASNTEWKDIRGANNLFGNMTFTSGATQDVYLKLTNNGTTDAVYKISFKQAEDTPETPGKLEMPVDIATQDAGGTENDPATQAVEKKLSQMLTFSYTVAEDTSTTNVPNFEGKEPSGNAKLDGVTSSEGKFPFEILVPAGETRYVKLTLAMDQYEGEWTVYPSIDLQLHIFITQPGNVANQDESDTQQMTAGMPVAADDAPAENEENQTNDPSVKVDTVIEVEDPQPAQEPADGAGNAPSDSSDGQTDSVSQPTDGNGNVENGGTESGTGTGETDEVPVTPVTESAPPAGTPVDTPAEPPAETTE